MQRTKENETEAAKYQTMKTMSGQKVTQIEQFKSNTSIFEQVKFSTVKSLVNLSSNANF